MEIKRKKLRRDIGVGVGEGRGGAKEGGQDGEVDVHV